MMTVMASFEYAGKARLNHDDWLKSRQLASVSANEDGEPLVLIFEDTRRLPQAVQITYIGMITAEFPMRAIEVKEWKEA